MKKLFELVGNGFQYILTAIQTNEILQIVELVLSIVTTLFILGINIWSWFKKANKDGKIDKEEKEELDKIIEDGLENLKK